MNVLISKKSGKTYQVIPIEVFNRWPQKTRDKFLVVDQGTKPYLKKKMQMLITYLGSNGRES